MKKQFQILAATFIAVAFISCSKEKIETEQPKNFEEIATAKGGQNGLPPVSSKGLLGRFEFNNNLKDATNQLPDGVSTANRVLFTTDRKGVANQAIKFNGAYGVNIFGVPLDSNMSVSVWVRYDALPIDYRREFVSSPHSFSLSQLDNTFQGAHLYYGGWTVLGPITANNNWHHLAATFDGNTLNFYIDGFLVGSGSSWADSGPVAATTDYLIGYGYNAGYKYWKGAMDDLRFYKRILPAAEVNTLANL